MSNAPAHSLFSSTAPRPLADRLRPNRVEDVLGQEHLLTPDAPLGRMIASGAIRSCVLWGPPGVGKTTLARLLAQKTDLHFEPLSAIGTGVADLRKQFDAAKERRFRGTGTLLFVDEIHRFKRDVQDTFLPHVEDGTIVLVGATTENPSFELNAALLSRCQVVVLKALDAAALGGLMQRVENETGRLLPLTTEARATLVEMAGGDGRYLLNMCEELLALPAGQVIDPEKLGLIVQRRAALHDKARDGHYNLLSAFHKSIRGSDPDAALYWFARLLEGGETPRAIARRMVIIAAEDIGMADPQALPQAVAAAEAYERAGSPEGELALAQAIVYMATAPKSNAAYAAYKAARALAAQTASVPPPLDICNAPTKLMRDLGYKKGYVYDPDTPEGFSGQNYFPEGMSRPTLNLPVERGYEREIRKRLDYWGKLRASKTRR